MGTLQKSYQDRFLVSKSLDRLIRPYLPNIYGVKSRDEFLDVLTSNDNVIGEPISLDVESLFTNIPVYETIDIILNNVYHHATKSPPTFPRSVLKELLVMCTTQVPFRHVNGKLYLQTDGVSMGCPLGPIFAEYYMCTLENRILSDNNCKPGIYARYVDDIFIVSDDSGLKKLKEAFENNSVLKFTFEKCINKKLPFLDIMVDCSSGNFVTSVYRKPTDAGIYLNAKSECPLRYKKSILIGFLKRAHKVSTTWELFNLEVKRIKQLLINNGYSNTFVDTEISKFLSKVEQNIDLPVDVPIKTLYYRNQFHDNYKQDEQIIKRMVRNNITAHNCNVKVIVYYKCKRTSSYVMMNNQCAKNKRPLTRNHVVYEFSCPIIGCYRNAAHKRPNSYVGHTRCSLSHRLSGHQQHGSILDHFTESHGVRITRSQIVDNTRIRYTEQDPIRLKILEALVIKFESPSINSQLEAGVSRILKLFC